MKALLVIAAIVMVAGSALAGELSWKQDYDKALIDAKAGKKLVMVDVYTDWCGWCKKLDRDVYTDKHVQELVAKDFIPVKINPEKTAYNRRIADKFGVRGYPHILFLDGDGKKLGEISGYVPADEFAKRLERAASK